MTRPFRDLDDIAVRLGQLGIRVTRKGNQLEFPCPLPGHKTPKGHGVVTCYGDHAGFYDRGETHSQAQFLDWLGVSSLQYSLNGDKPEPHIAATYDYTDEKGVLLFQTVRYEPKDFKQRRPDGNGGYIYNIKGVSRVLYHLPEIAQAIVTGQTVYVVEGEKDADNGREKLGLVCTTSPGGAGKWRDEYSDTLTGADVVIIPDNDTVGEAHAKQVFNSLKSHAASVRIAHLPTEVDGQPIKDLSDWIAAGGTSERFRELVDSATSTDTTTPLRLSFQTAAELADTTPEELDWVAHGLVAKGASTEIDSGVKVGKSTLMWHLIKAVLTSTPFLGFETQYSPVVYLSEERQATLRAAIERVDLLGRTDLHLLYRHTTTGLSWPEIVTEAHTFAKSVGAGVLVVDTLARWAGLKADEENNAGAAAESMDPLEAPAADGLAVVVLRHNRKGGGSLGESARGSSAFTGCVDIVLNLEKANTEGHSNRRKLTGVGRFEEVPEELIIELQDGKYVALGDKADIERNDAKSKILDYLPGPDDEPCLTKELKEALAPISPMTLSRALAELVKDGSVVCHDKLGEKKRSKGYTKSSNAINHIGYAPGTSHIPTSPLRDLDIQCTSPPSPDTSHIPDIQCTSPPSLLVDSITTRPGKCGICGPTDLFKDADGNLVCCQCHTVVVEVPIG